MNYGDGSGYPGAPAEIEIINVSVEDIDISNIIEDVDDGWSKIEALVWNNI